MLLKCYTQCISKYGKLSSGHRTGKVQFSHQSQRRAMPKNVQTNVHLPARFISHASKVILKILQASLQQYTNWELPDVQAGFCRGREIRDQITNIHCHGERKESQKNIYFCFINYTKAFDCVNHNKLWKIFKEMGVQIILPVSWETCMQVKSSKQELEL